MSFLGQEEQLREFHERFRFLYLALLFAFVILLSRLIYLQLLQGDRMRQYSEENRIKKVSIPAPRGMIFDRNRTLLIDNQPAFDLEVIPQYLKESGSVLPTIKHISQLVGMTVAEIQERLEKAKSQPAFMPVKIKTDLSRDEVAKIETWKIAMPGVGVAMEIKRTNVYGDIASHLLGYISKANQDELPRLNEKSPGKYKLGDDVGKTGIEKELEDLVRGDAGYEVAEVDALGRRVRKENQNSAPTDDEPPEKTARPGNNLVLTIDQDLQLAAAQAFGQVAGGLVAMDPKTGEILAMISRPSYDPTEFSRGISPELWRALLDNPDRPLRDKTIQDHYPPGSVFKPITAIAGLEEGVINPNVKQRCTGSMRLGNRLYHCHKKGGHGDVNLIEAIEQSCDIYFYKTAMKLKSIDQLAKWASAFGFGVPTGINLPREVSGLVPTEEWKKRRYDKEWTAGESLSVAIGQSFVLATALQLANAYSAISNGGILYQPHYVKTIESFDSKHLREQKPEIIHKIDVKPETLTLIKRGLYEVMNGAHGTAYRSRIAGAEMGGKTGTAQVVRISADKIYQKCNKMKYLHRHHGLFAGVAPISDPSIVVAVIAEHQCGGSTGAAPIAKAVIQKYFEKYKPEYLKQSRNTNHELLIDGVGDSTE